MNKEQAIKNLVDVQKAFPKGFLAYGSALGAHRDGDIISHDLDTDFGVFSEDFNFDAINGLLQNGFKILNIFGMRYHGFEIALARGGVKTDVMIIYKREFIQKNSEVGFSTEDKKKTIYWNSLWDNGGRGGMVDEIRHEYKSDVFLEKSIIKIGDHNFNYFGEKYIEAVYGEDWMTPVTPWNWRTDHKCLKKDE